MAPASSPPSGKLAGRKRCADNGCRKLAPHGTQHCVDHPPAAQFPGDDITGRTEPRLWSPPLRPLTRDTTRGFEANEFAETIGEPNLPWQQWLNIHALELNPNGTYRFRIVLVIVGRQNGKSTVKRKVSLWRLYVDGARVVLGTAQDVALAREQMNLCKATIYSSPDLAAEWGGERSVNGDEQFWLQADAPAGTPREVLPRYVIRATNRKAGRGLSIDELNIDELREQRDWKAWAALSKTLNARPNGQIWVMSNMGDDESVVLNQLRAAAGVSTGADGVSVLGPARDVSIGIFEWSAPEDCAIDDWDAIAQANPGLNCGGPTSAAIRTSMIDPPEVYRTEVLCQRVDSLDAAINPLNWKDCRDPLGNLNDLRDRTVACVDVAPDGEHVTLAVGAQLDDGRVRGEISAAWKTTREARDQLPALLDQIQPRATAWFPSGPSAALAPILRPRSGSLELKGQQVNEACMGLADLVDARRVLHPGDPLLDAHVTGATKYYVGDGWRFVRRGAGHVDAAYAFAGIAHAALTVPVIVPIKPLIIAGRRAG